MKMNLNLKKEAGKAVDFMDRHGTAVTCTVAVLVYVAVGAACIKEVQKRNEFLSSFETSKPRFITFEY